MLLRFLPTFERSAFTNDVKIRCLGPTLDYVAFDGCIRDMMPERLLQKPRHYLCPAECAQIRQLTLIVWAGR